jgi:hypothetical protein
MSQPGDLLVAVQPWFLGSIVISSSIRLRAQNWPWSELSMQIHDEWRGVTIDVIPSWDQDLEPVSLVQAFLSGGVAQSIRDGGRFAKIRIKPPNDPFVNAGFTIAGLKAQMMPLLPFSPSHTSLESKVGEGGCVEVCMQIR